MLWDHALTQSASMLDSLGLTTGRSQVPPLGVIPMSQQMAFLLTALLDPLNPQLL